MKRSVRANLLLTLTALIWGAAFVAQDVAADSLGSFTFNGLRMALAALAMLPVIAALDRKARKTGQDTSWRGMTPAQRRTLLTGGVGNVFGSFFGVLINGTISSLVKTNGKLSSSWPNVVTALLLCFFIVLQAIFAKVKARRS